MADRWYYTHDEAIHGPVTVAELRGLVQAGGLLPNDLVWPAGRQPREGVPAEAALHFPEAPPADPLAGLAAPQVPDWLPDLAGAMAMGQDPADLPAPPPDVWLPDVGRAEGSGPPPVE